MMNALDGSVTTQPLRDGQGITIVLLHANGKSFDPAEHKEAILRSGAGAHRVLQKPDPFGKIRPIDYDRTAHHIGVSVDVLRGGVDHDVHAEFQRPLEVR